MKFNTSKKKLLSLIFTLIGAIGTIFTFFWGSDLDELEQRNLIRDEMGKPEITDEEWDLTLQDRKRKKKEEILKNLRGE